MAESTTQGSASGGAPSSKPTLGLTGLTVNAMALIAPGAFLWLTFAMQAQYGAPMAGSGMWFGIVVALLLCFATAISYAELSKLYPGAGSSYFFAEQAFLSKSAFTRFARIAKFAVGWASHLYYWVYPGVMVGVTALLTGYLMGQLFPETFNAAVPSPLFMAFFCAVFGLGVAYIAYRGVTGTTAVNFAINVIQIVALLVFSVMAISYRLNHKDGDTGWALNPDGVPEQVVCSDKLDADGKPIKGSDGKNEQKQETAIISYAADGAITKELEDAKDEKSAQVDTFQYHDSALSVVTPHGLSYVIIQACIAILILVGFESVTSMGEEAKNAKRDIPRAVLLSLAIQGIFCYLIEYFAAGFFLHNNYKMSTAAGSSAPLGDMMQLVGAWAFGSAKAGWWFMFVQAITVFLALIGTTLSCLSTGARVTYAMGRDQEVPEHFGMLHGKNLTPHRAIWTLAVLSVIIGIVSIAFNFCGPAAQTDETIAGLPKNAWYSICVFSNGTAVNIPQSLLVMTLLSNFGTFVLYMVTCIVALVAFNEKGKLGGFKHLVIPVLGVLANFLCLLFYLIGPFCVTGMSWKEPYIALALASIWGVYGLVYFLNSSKAKSKPIFLHAADHQPSAAGA